MPSPFTGELTITQLSGNDPGQWWLWRLEDELIYEVGALGSGKEIRVPSKFETDGASIPRPLWALLPVWGRWSRAGVLHDYICALLAEGRPHPCAPTRKACDAIFHEAMLVLGTNRVTAFVLWVGVRIGALLGLKTKMSNYNPNLEA